MAKKIIISYKGSEYTLEFNRKTVKRMEDSGFVVDTDKPATMITALFRGAFQMHHKMILPALTEEIWDAQRDKEGLLSALIGMYTEPISDLMNEPEGDGEDANPTWKAV